MTLEWRPIGSAPKDGSRFWARMGDDAIAVLWHGGFEAFVTSWRRMEMAPGYTIDGAAYQDHSPVVVVFTEWTPLPAGMEAS